ncbi:2',3'-cyclic-nucleotide 3'-phosphodiesterase [Chiua virens]|nr:2',3'-cyclic-nucleotide 3'-phosphodiesterase [Chiua virens]
MGISLWLVAQMDMIKSSLPRCASTDHHHSPSSYPTILPHITLATVPSSDLGIPDVLLNAVPENHPPIHANFRSLAVGDHYYRSVFIDIHPTQELVGFQNQILAHLRDCGLKPSAPRFPHMSLCYIADQDKADRDEIAHMMTDTGVVRQIGDGQSISLQCGDVRLTGFDGVEVWLVKCEGPVETWEVDKRRVKLVDPKYNSRK